MRVNTFYGKNLVTVWNAEELRKNLKPGDQVPIRVEELLGNHIIPKTIAATVTELYPYFCVCQYHDGSVDRYKDVQYGEILNNIKKIND